MPFLVLSVGTLKVIVQGLPLYLYSEISSGCAQGTIYGAGEQIQINQMQGKHP